MNRNPFNLIINYTVDNIKIALDDNVVPIIGWRSENWGDALNYFLVKILTGKKPIIVNPHTMNIGNKPIYSAIGSVLESANKYNCRNNNLVVWGTGFSSDQARLVVQPKKIVAVRGPLTRDILLKQGYEVPEIFGDPALLFPRIYKPDKSIKYKIGIIPHFTDRNNDKLKNFIDDPNVIIIDILSGINSVVDQICCCQRIVSSSLHGIIAADSYGIPSKWIRFDDGEYNKFKYLDYFNSVNRNENEPYIVRGKTTLDDLIFLFDQYKININLNDLAMVCPFDQKHLLLTF